MRVAEGVIDPVHPAMRREVVRHEDAPAQIRRDVAALFARAIEGECRARRRVQPPRLAGDVAMSFAHAEIAGFIEAASRGLGYALANSFVDFAQLSRLLPHKRDEAGRTDQRRAESAAQRLSGATLGDSCWTFRKIAAALMRSPY